jgi:hypothetical protein
VRGGPMKWCTIGWLRGARSKDNQREGAVSKRRRRAPARNWRARTGEWCGNGRRGGRRVAASECVMSQHRATRPPRRMDVRSVRYIRRKVLRRMVMRLIDANHGAAVA